MPLLQELRDAVRADGRSQLEIARCAGMDAVSLSRFMRGHLRLKTETAERLADALHLAVRLTRKGAKAKGRKGKR